MGVKSNVQGVPLSNLKDALVNADAELGITVATASYSEICDALFNYFPEFSGEIYTNGTQNIPLDNTGYRQSPTVNTSGGATLNANSFTFALPATNRTRVVLTNAKVPLHGFTKLKAICDGTTVTLDITQYANQQAYVWVQCSNDGTYWAYYMGITTEKENYGTYSLATSSIIKSGISSSYSAKAFTKIWLE